MFYFSVLIKDGKAYIDYDADGLPVFGTLTPHALLHHCTPHTASHTPPRSLQLLLVTAFALRGLAWQATPRLPSWW